MSLGIVSEATASAARGLRAVSVAAAMRGTRTAWRRRTCRSAPAFQGLGRRRERSAGEETIASARQGSSGRSASACAAIEPPSEKPSTAKRA